MTAEINFKPKTSDRPKRTDGPVSSASRVARMLFLFVLISGTTYGQEKGALFGRLLDSSGKQSLENASIRIIDPVDSSLKIWAESTKGGGFILRQVPLGHFLFTISFEGYKTVTRIIDVKAASLLIDLGNIYMSPSASQLTNIQVKAPPVQLKNDTVEYNADSYKVHPNGSLRDLLNELPGVQANPDGTIQANGESIQQIYVDGKPYFGDLATALKYLPKEIIDKVQVYGAQNDRTVLTGFDDGSRIQTINITTKKKYQNSSFGQAEVGIGSEQTYLADANYQRLKAGEQMALITGANNTNVSGASPGGEQGGTGINAIERAGINYRNTNRKNTSFTGSYLLNADQVNSSQQTQTQAIIDPDSSTLSHQQQLSTNKSQQHNLLIGLDQKLDSAYTLSVRSNASLHHTTGMVSGNDEMAGGISNNPIYNATSQNSNSGHTQDVTAGISLTHRARDRHRSINLNLDISQTGSSGPQNSQSINGYISPNSYTDTVNQQNNATSHSLSFRPSATLMQALGKDRYFQLGYGFNASNSSNANQIYQFNDLTQQFDLLDTSTSGRFNFSDRQHLVRFGFGQQKRKYNIIINGVLQNETMVTRDAGKETSWSQHYTTITPAVNMDYSISKQQHFRIMYQATTTPPTIQELHPLVPTTDSLHIEAGNPNLKSSFSHRFTASYLSISPISHKMFGLTFSGVIKENAVQSETTTLSNGAQVTMPINLSGSRNFTGQADYSFPIGALALECRSEINFSENPTIVNSLSSNMQTILIQSEVSLKIHIRKSFNAVLNGQGIYNDTHYNLQTNENARYFTENLRGELYYYPEIGWMAALNFSYSYNNSLSPGFRRSVPLVCPSISRLFLKDQAGEAKLYVFDALNENISVTRNNAPNTVTETQTNVRTRYVMFSLIYHLKPKAHNRT